MKKSISLLICLVMCFSAFPFVSGCAKEQQPEEFDGMYDEIYDKNAYSSWDIKDGVLYGFEKQDNELFMRRTDITGFSGKLEYSDDENYVSSGKYSLKNTVTADTNDDERTITYRFMTGDNGKNIAKLSKITLDLYNVRGGDIKVRSKFVFASFGSDFEYSFPETTAAAESKTAVTLQLSHEVKDVLKSRPEYGLGKVTHMVFEFVLPSGVDGDKVFHLDDLHYHADDTDYSEDGGATEFARKDFNNGKDREMNCFDDANRALFLIPEYPWDDGVNNYTAPKEFFLPEYDSSFSHDGGGSLKVTNVGWHADDNVNDHKNPGFSFYGDSMIGAENFGDYKTFSFWFYYAKENDSSFAEQNPDEVKFVFEMHTAQTIFSSDAFALKANVWQQVKIDISSVVSRNKVRRIRFWGWGLTENQNTQVYYFDDMRFSKDEVPYDELEANPFDPSLKMPFAVIQDAE